MTVGGQELEMNVSIHSPIWLFLSKLEDIAGTNTHKTNSHLLTQARAHIHTRETKQTPHIEDTHRHKHT